MEEAGTGEAVKGKGETPFPPPQGETMLKVRFTITGARKFYATDLDGVNWRQITPEDADHLIALGAELEYS
jgi:hypothetical protein